MDRIKIQNDLNAEKWPEISEVKLNKGQCRNITCKKSKPDGQTQNEEYLAKQQYYTVVDHKREHKLVMSCYFKKKANLLGCILRSLVWKTFPSAHTSVQFEAAHIKKQVGKLEEETEITGDLGNILIKTDWNNWVCLFGGGRLRANIKTGFTVGYKKDGD